MNDNVNHPAHYTQGGIECIDAIEAAVTGLTGSEAVWTAQIIRYIWRWKRKNGAEDLRKAEFYLKRLIETVERKQNVPPAEIFLGAMTDDGR